ncbi:helicase-associated domain-containing protein [Neomoorella thermoacetica]|uniref:helicase-associated domain-containing protein n=1 Tax=Neomoorella thermoacetica TaxID=1525 RepID=UPI0008FB3648|nr:helicase-associated domain-containing protein [Moorella thermoacetica]OIQ62742.1 hypothetical protein MTIN_01990 [Moorella thermoacetica]
MDSYQEILKDAPLDFLQKLAGNLNLATKGGKRAGRGSEDGWQALYNKLVAYYSSPDNLETLWQKIGPSGQLALEIIHFSEPYYDEVSRVHERLNKILGKRAAREARELLLGWGLIFLSENEYGLDYYDLPLEVRKFINYKVLPLLVKKDGIPLPEQRENHGLFFWLDFYILLAGVLQREVRVTQTERVFYKRDRKKIMLCQHYPDDESRYLLLEEVAWANDFLVEKNGCARLSAKTWEWLQLPRYKQWLIFVDWVINHYFQCRNIWGTHILGFLLTLPPEKWLSLPALYQLIHKYNTPSQANYILANNKELLQRFLWLGLIEVAGGLEQGCIRITDLFRRYFNVLLQHDQEVEETDGEVFREAIEGFFPEASSFIVQPNFEVIAPLELSPNLFMQLSTFTDLVSADRMFIFSLNEKAFYRGFTRGRQPEEMLKFLQEHSKYELPPNVLTTVEEWAAKMGKVSLVKGVLVRCQKEELAEQVKALLEARGWLIEAITPQVFLVPENRGEECLELLEKQGFMPHPQLIALRAGGEDDVDIDESPNTLLARFIEAALKKRG